MAMVYNQNYRCIYLHICYDIYTELTMIIKTSQFEREKEVYLIWFGHRNGKKKMI